MADFLTPKQRSALMATVRSRGNRTTEVALAILLRRYGITGWRRHQPLPGRPDFIFRNARLAVFVDGCFWHGCPIHGRTPTTRRTHWRKKLEANRARDRRVGCELRKRGWRVLRIWEHSLHPRAALRTIGRLLRALE